MMGDVCARDREHLCKDRRPRLDSAKAWGSRLSKDLAPAARGRVEGRWTSVVAGEMHIRTEGGATGVLATDGAGKANWGPRGRNGDLRAAGGCGSGAAAPGNSPAVPPEARR